MTHEYFLQIAIEESAVAVICGSSPFGALIVRDGTVIAKAHNTVSQTNDPTAHAEINCIRLASENLRTHDLSGCILYTSCEPCPMCLNAIKWANITDVYFAATRDDADKIGFRDKVFYENNDLNLHHIDMPSAVDVMRGWDESPDKKRY
ncbi:MAG: nucleoside deaminase [Lactobacillales bacterium]|nr:nucleoside deaminase [Lactobacillales bacterium]